MGNVHVRVLMKGRKGRQAKYSTVQIRIHNTHCLMSQHKRGGLFKYIREPPSFVDLQEVKLIFTGRLSGGETENKEL